MNPCTLFSISTPTIEDMVDGILTAIVYLKIHFDYRRSAFLEILFQLARRRRALHGRLVDQCWMAAYCGCSARRSRDYESWIQLSVRGSVLYGQRFMLLTFRSRVGVFTALVNG